MTPYRKHIAQFILLAMVALVAMISCTQWDALSKGQQVSACQALIQIAVEPECVRLDEVSDTAVKVCQELVSDAKLACDAGINDEPGLMCASINESKVRLINELADLGERDAATVARLTGVADLICSLYAPAPVEPEAAGAGDEGTVLASLDGIKEL